MQLYRGFTLGQGPPGTHCSGAWVGPRAHVDAEVRGNLLPPPRVEPWSFTLWLADCTGTAIQAGRIILVRR